MYTCCRCSIRSGETRNTFQLDDGTLKSQSQAALPHFGFDSCGFRARLGLGTCDLDSGLSTIGAGWFLANENSLFTDI